MDATKQQGRSALATPNTALSTTSHNGEFTGSAANEQPGADVFAGTAMRCLRRFMELRLRDAKLSAAVMS